MFQPVEPLQVADEIVLMHPLHDHDDTRRRLVVAARKQGGTVPFDDSRPHGLRHGVAKLERIVDDDPRGAPQDREKAVIQLAENQALHFRRLVATIKKGDL